jgi:DNA gyrase subunit A
LDVISEEDTELLIITSGGLGKRTPLTEYRQQGRYGSGIRTLKRDERTGTIVGMRCVNSRDDILLITHNSTVLRTRLEQIRDVGRNTLGVRVMDLADGDYIVGVAVLKSEDDTAADGTVNGAVAG